MGVGGGLQVGATRGTLAARSSVPAPSQGSGVHGERKKPPPLSSPFWGGLEAATPSPHPLLGLRPASSRLEEAHQRL